MPSRIDWSKTTVRLSRCARVRCELGWQLGPAWSKSLADFDLWLVWAGRGRMQTDRGELILRPGLCLWMRPGSRYEAVQDESDRLGVNYIHFMLHGQEGRPLLNSPAIPAEVREVEDPSYFETVTSRIIELRRRALMRDSREPAGTEGIPELLMEALLREFEAGVESDRAGELGGLPKHHRDVIFRQVARIYESPASVPEVRELAREAGYSPDHFSRIFKQVTGQTPQGLKLQARIERARQLLTESSLSIGMIAAALGYEDVFFFSRQFKKKTGMSPSEYRRH